MRRILLFTLFLLTLVLAIIMASYQVIKNSTKPYIYNNVDSLPYNKVGLILGTSPYFGNLYFKNRIDAAILLFFAGKINRIIVSGDNHLEGYDEPTMMKKVLVARGIPDSCIILDYAGFRTLDSIVRCKEVFGQNEFTIISQAFHNERALFIAEKFGVHAIAYNADDVSKNYGIKTTIREYFARVKCIIDLYILHTQPHFLGEKIQVN